MSTRIPLIDLEPWFDGNPQQRQQLCFRLRQVCHEIGFFYTVNHGDSVRYSSAFFYSPDLNTVLDPLPIDPEYIAQVDRSKRHREEGLMASRAEMAGGTGDMASQFRPAVFGEKYWQRWVRSYPDITQKFYPTLMD